jgi:hypothetical protein
MSIKPAFPASRVVALTTRLLLPLLAAAALACGADEPAASSTEDDASDEEGRDAPTPDNADAGRAAGGPRGDGGRVSARDAATGTPPPGDEEQRADASRAPARDAAVDAGRSPSGGDSAVELDDAAAPRERADAGVPGNRADGGASADKTIPMTIPPASNGAGEIRPSTTVLKSGKNGGNDVWDFENKKIGVNNSVDCEGSEGQLTVFEVEDGVTVKNLIIAGGRPGGNGIVCKGNCTLDHVYWEDVCEDAATNSKDGATMTLDHVIALHATDKMFQHNAKGGSKTVIRNSYVSDFGKLWRSCGDCDSNGGPRHLEIDNVRVDGIKTTVAGANRNYGDTVTVKDLYVRGGYDASKDKPKICQEYIGVTDHNGESTKVDDGKSQWSTSTCKLSVSDVKSF